MINSRLYKLRQEYSEDLQKRIEAEYSCPKCSKKEVKITIFKEKRVWEVKGVCSSCNHTELYSEVAEFRGYVIGQYKYILRANNPDIKIKFFKENNITPPPPRRPEKVVKKEPPKQHFFKGKEPVSDSKNPIKIIKKISKKI